MLVSSVPLVMSASCADVNLLVGRREKRVGLARLRICRGLRGILCMVIVDLCWMYESAYRGGAHDNDSRIR